jgi:hypothetical protein
MGVIMQRLQFKETFRSVKLSKKYIFFAIFFGLSTLIIPLAVQFLVNNLVLAGIWLNTLSFLIIIGVGLVLTQTLLYCQVVITEFLQREIFIHEMHHWQKSNLSEKSYYYFEIVKSMKSYALAFTNMVEVGLVIGFGLLTIILFHPAFLILPIMISIIIYLVYKDTCPAVETSITESNRKYDLFFLISDSKEIGEEDIDNYLKARNTHFRYIKKNTILIGCAYILTQLLLLGGGIYFIQTNQLSVGQLVSAEIILSGIMASMTKIPKTMEDLYDFETSKYKLSIALEGGTHG